MLLRPQLPRKPPLLRKSPQQPKQRQLPQLYPLQKQLKVPAAARVPGPWPTKEGLPLDGIAGTGPNGLVIERDVEAALAHRPRLSPAAKDALAVDPSLSVPARGSGPDGLVLVEDLGTAAPAAAPSASPALAEAGAVTDIPVKGIRKVIASRMRASSPRQHS